MYIENSIKKQERMETIDQTVYEIT